MKRWSVCIGTSILVGCASAPPPAPEPPPTQLYIADQSAEAPPPPPTTPPPQAEPAPAPAALPSDAAAVAAPAPAPAPVPAPSEAPPASAEWSHEYATGRWVYANGYGWIWVPANSASAVDDGVPYAYLYTPRYGWTWYVSPWGPGPYHYGVWVRRPYYPRGYRGAWVAGPRVTVRLGGPRYYHGYRYRAPHRGRRW